MESLIQGHFDGDPGRAMTRAEQEAIAVDSAKKASDARDLLRLKKTEEGELRAKSGDSKSNKNSRPRGYE